MNEKENTGKRKKNKDLSCSIDEGTLGNLNNKKLLNFCDKLDIIRSNSQNTNIKDFGKKYSQSKTEDKNLINKYNIDYLVELIGIILGDGHLHYDLDEHRYFITVTLNGVDEFEYVDYVRNLFNKILHLMPKENWEREKPSSLSTSKAIHLTIYNKEFVEFLIEMGMISGNKTLNQVNVPEWIIKNEKYQIKCLKGLFDTDGSIYVNASRKSIYLSFSNASKRLINDFKSMCNNLDISCNLYGPYKRTLKYKGKEIICATYSVRIIKKEEVKKFLNLIEPEKWNNKNRREYIGLNLIYFNLPNWIRQSIDEHIANSFSHKKETKKFTITYKEYLVDLFQKFDVIIDYNKIEKVINEALEIKYLQYSKEFAEELRNIAIELGSLKKVTYSLDKKFTSTVHIYIKRLFKEIEYIEKYGERAFEIWKKYNYKIFLSKNKIDQFSFHIKKDICKYFFKRIFDDSINFEDLFLEWEEIVHNIDLNGNNISNEEGIYFPFDEWDTDLSEENEFKVPIILKYERLSFLLNHISYRPVLKKYFYKLYLFSRVISDLLHSESKLSLDEFKKYLRNKYSINWRSENIKLILEHIKIFDQLIR